MFKFPENVVDVLGGPTEVGRLLRDLTGKTYDKQRVGNWRTRGVPAAVVPLLDRELTDRLRRAMRYRPRRAKGA